MLQIFLGELVSSFELPATHPLDARDIGTIRVVQQRRIEEDGLSSEIRLVVVGEAVHMTAHLPAHEGHMEAEGTVAFLGGTLAAQRLLDDALVAALQPTARAPQKRALDF